MNPKQFIGAIRFPAFLLIWSAGLVLFMGQFYPADAALIRHAERDWLAAMATPLPAIPRVNDRLALGASLETALGAGDVASGRWQPAGNNPPAQVRAAVERTSIAQRAPEEHPAARDEPSAVKTQAVAVASRYAKRARVDSEEKSPDPVADTKRAARLAIKSSRPEHAYALLMSDVSRARDDVEFLGLLAVAALQRGLFAEAQVVYRKLVEVDPRNHRWWAGLALTEKRLGQNSNGSLEEVLKLADEKSRLRQLAVDELRQT